MGANEPEPGPRPRGRPRGRSSDEVVERLINTAEELLRDTNHVVLTERRIASAAGVNERMIHYYFNSKDGLIFAVISRYRDKISEDLAALLDIPSDTPEMTRHIINVLMVSYYSKPWIAKVGASELARSESVIKDMILDRYSAKGFSFADIRAALRRLMTLGAYDPRADVDHIARAMITVITAPYFLPPFLVDDGCTVWNLEREGWVDYVVDLFDRQLRPSYYAGSAGPRT